MGNNKENISSRIKAKIKAKDEHAKLPISA
jgi:hypothetical protein